MSERMFSEDELAAELNTTKATVAEWRRTYKWPHTKFGRKFYYTAEQYDAIKKAHAVTPTAAAPITGQTARSAARRRAS